MKAVSGYIRLPGRGKLVTLARSTLWLGSDHLLLLTTMTGTEEYRRFNYRDIQAIITRRTRARWHWNLVLLTLAAAAAVPAAWSLTRGSAMGVADIFFLIMSLLFVVCALANTLRGATCVCHVRTAVQTEPLPSLHRLRVARRAIESIRHRIEAAQGDSANVELATADWDFSPVSLIAQRVAMLRVNDPSAKPASARAHVALFCLLIADGFISLLHLGHQWLLLEALALTTMLAGFIVLVVALNWQREAWFPRGVRRLAWSALVYYVAMVGVGMVYGFIYSLRHLGATVVSTTTFYVEPGFKEIVFVASIVSILLGTLGLILLYRGRHLAPGVANIPA